MADQDDATFELTEAGRREKEQQEKLLREFEMRRKVRSTVVPTDDGKVRTLLRQLGEPITLFGEKEMERRERLRKVLAEREAEGQMVDGAPLVGQVVVEEVVAQKELFYTEGSEQLKEARSSLADWSLPRAARRLRVAAQQREDVEVLRELKRARQTSEAAAKQLSQACSEIGDDRPLGGCAFSPDGHVLAACGWGGHVGLWGAADCRRLLGFRAATERVTDIAWHPFARGEGLLAASGQQQQGEEGGAGGEEDGDLLALATGCADGTASVWTIRGKQLAMLEGHTDRCGRISFHPMGRHLGTSSFDMTWRLWDLETSTCLLEQEGHSRAVYDVDFQVDGSLAASVGLDAIGRIWDLRTGRSVHVLEGHVKQVLSVRWSPDGWHLATGSDDHSVKVWDVRKKSCLYTIPAHRSLVSAVRWQPGSGHTLLTAGYDCLLKVWSTRDFSLLKVLAGHEGKIMGADMCPCPEQVVKRQAPAAAGAEDMEGLEGAAAAAAAAEQQQGSAVALQHLVGSVSYDRTIKLWQPEEVPDLGLELDVDEEILGMAEDVLMA